MPTYEYACRQCGEHLEVVQSFRDDPLTTCPNCEGDLRKVFHAIGISFKGSGFYRTDSRDGSGGAKPAKDAKAKTGTDSPSGPSSSTGGTGDTAAKTDKSATAGGGASAGTGDSKAAASS